MSKFLCEISRNSHEFQDFKFYRASKLSISQKITIIINSVNSLIFPFQRNTHGIVAVYFRSLSFEMTIWKTTSQNIVGIYPMNDALGSKICLAVNHNSHSSQFYGPHLSQFRRVHGGWQFYIYFRDKKSFERVKMGVHGRVRTVLYF